MSDFIIAALPFVIVGICVAIIFVKSRNAKSKEEKEGLAKRMSVGMCLGMCSGVVASTVFHFNFGLGITLGMLIGETVGLFARQKG